MTDQTILLPTDAQNITESIAAAAAYLLAGQVIAFPTETVYGLGARCDDAAQIASVFRIKKRPSDNPLIAHVATVDDIPRLASVVTPTANILIERFFPGPLTVVLPRRASIPAIVSAGLDTIAIRMPANPIAQRLITSVGAPLVAPSANRSGLPSPTTAHHVLQDLAGLIPAILDGGECAVGIESTVVSCLTDNPVILRPGSITKSAIEEALGREATYATAQMNGVMLSPGMKYRHYAPQAKVLLCHAYEAMNYVGAAATVVLTATPTLFMDMIIADSAKESHAHALNNPHVLNNLRQLKQQTFYAELRRADEIGAHTVVIVLDDAIARNEGLMNRILKASGE